jgi:hypothetical protein
MISSVGLVCESGQGLDLINSVTIKHAPVAGSDNAGECLKRMHKLIESSDGLVWWLPLSESSRAKLNQEKFSDFLKGNDIRKYEMPQALRTVLNMIEENPFFDLSSYKQKEFDTFFCSQLAASGLKAGGVIENINPGEVTPAHLCSFNIFAEDYYQIKGRRKLLDQYNECDPEGFGFVV